MFVCILHSQGLVVLESPITDIILTRVEVRLLLLQHLEVPPRYLCMDLRAKLELWDPEYRHVPIPFVGLEFDGKKSDSVCGVSDPFEYISELAPFALDSSTKLSQLVKGFQALHVLQHNKLAHLYDNPLTKTQETQTCPPFGRGETAKRNAWPLKIPGKQIATQTTAFNLGFGGLRMINWKPVKVANGRPG